MELKTPYFLLFLTTLGKFTFADWNTHASASDLYIHSNDTFSLELDDEQPNVLRGPPGSRHNLKFILTNNLRERQWFFLNQESEDDFVGNIDQTEPTVTGGSKYVVNVRNLIIPNNLPAGMKLRYALKARLDRNSKRRKREEDPNKRQGAVGGDSISWSPNNPGGSSNYNPGGSSNYNPGGSSNYNPGGSSNYNPGGSSNYNPGGSSNNNPGGSNYNPGGSSNYNPGGSSNYNPGGSSNYNPGGSSNNNPGGSNYNPGGSSSYNPGGGSYNPGGSNQYNPGGWDDHASYRTLATVQLDFLITEPDDDFEDETEPWTKVEYGADSADETCQAKPGEPNCEREIWWAKFRIQDEESGLHSVRVSPTGKDTYNDVVYYRHINFPIGTTTEREVYAAASCCIEGMRLEVTDVAGETAERYAVFDGTGSGGLSNTAIYAIIGACVGVVLIIVIVIVVVVCKKQYSEVSQNP